MRKQLGQAVESTHAENNLELGLDDFCITVDILKATELCLQMQGTSGYKYDLNKSAFKERH